MLYRSSIFVFLLPLLELHCSKKPTTTTTTTTPPTTPTTTSTTTNTTTSTPQQCDGSTHELGNEDLSSQPWLPLDDKDKAKYSCGGEDVDVQCDNGTLKPFGQVACLAVCEDLKSNPPIKWNSLTKANYDLTKASETSNAFNVPCAHPFTGTHAQIKCKKDGSDYKWTITDGSDTCNTGVSTSLTHANCTESSPGGTNLASPFQLNHGPAVPLEKEHCKDPYTPTTDATIQCTDGVISFLKGKCEVCNKTSSGFKPKQMSAALEVGRERDLKDADCKDPYVAGRNGKIKCEDGEIKFPRSKCKKVEVIKRSSGCTKDCGTGKQTVISRCSISGRCKAKGITFKTKVKQACNTFACESKDSIQCPKPNYSHCTMISGKLKARCDDPCKDDGLSYLQGNDEDVEHEKCIDEYIKWFKDEDVKRMEQGKSDPEKQTMWLKSYQKDLNRFERKRLTWDSDDITRLNTITLNGCIDFKEYNTLEARKGISKQR